MAALRPFADVELVHTERPLHAAELARTGADDGFDAVLVMAGDGTVNEVVNGVGARVPLGCPALRRHERAGARDGALPRADRRRRPDRPGARRRPRAAPAARPAERPPVHLRGGRRVRRRRRPPRRRPRPSAWPTARRPLLRAAGRVARRARRLPPGARHARGRRADAARRFHDRRQPAPLDLCRYAPAAGRAAGAAREGPRPARAVRAPAAGRAAAGALPARDRRARPAARRADRLPARRRPRPC